MWSGRQPAGWLAKSACVTVNTAVMAVSSFVSRAIVYRKPTQQRMTSDKLSVVSHVPDNKFDKRQNYTLTVITAVPGLMQLAVAFICSLIVLFFNISTANNR